MAHIAKRILNTKQEQTWSGSMKRIMARLQSLDASLVSVLSEWATWGNLVTMDNPDAHLSNLGSDCVRNRRLRRSPVSTLVFFLFCIQFFPFANLAAQSAPARTESPDSFPSKSWQTHGKIELYGIAGRAGASVSGDLFAVLICSP